MAKKNSVSKKEKRLEFLKEIAGQIAGAPAEDLVDVLYNKKNVNEFLIARKLNLNANQTRNILYSLADKGLVSFVRKKDTKKGGWYVYFWTLDVLKSIALLKDRLVEELNIKKEELKKRKSQRFYYDVEADLEYSEEEALEHGFIGPETGEVLELKDTSGEIKGLEKDVSDLQEVLKEVEEDLEELQQKADKNKQKRIEEEARKKAEQRAKKRKAKKAAEGTKKKKTKKKTTTKKKKTKKTKKKATTKKKTSKKTTKKTTTKKKTKKTKKKTTKKKR